MLIKVIAGRTQVPLRQKKGTMVSADAIPTLAADVAALKDEGNDFFRAGEFLKAAGSYTKAIKVSTVSPLFGTDIFFVF